MARFSMHTSKDGLCQLRHATCLLDGHRLLWPRVPNRPRSPAKAGEKSSQN